MNRLPTVKLHPHAIKHLKIGHPWITKDSFTEEFPKEHFLQWKENDDNYTFLHDWNHPKVKARLWVQGLPHNTWTPKLFQEQLQKRLETAFNLRRQSTAWNEREDLYLVYAENDDVPGLMIMRLGNSLLIQNYLDFWKSYKKQLMAIVSQLGFKLLEENFNLIWQDRTRDQKKSLEAFSIEAGKMTKALPLPLAFQIQEFGINYSISIGEDYDFGLYPDMADVRVQLLKSFKNKKLLNLFSYTGAFALYALDQGAELVTNIDSSSKSHKWLEKNLALNPKLPQDKSIQLKADVAASLEKMVKEKAKYDLIICDPPPYSSRKTKSAKNSKGIDIYQSLPQMLELLNPKGKILAALNTQKISPKNFEDQIRKSLKSAKATLQSSPFTMADCPHKRGFPEGRFLKLILIEKN